MVDKDEVLLMEPSVELITPALEISNFPHYVELAARECYQSQDKAHGASAKFVRMLIKRGHTSALEHCKFVYRIICSRAASHQLVRHRHSSYSQQSQRFVVAGVPEVIYPPHFGEANKELYKRNIAKIYSIYNDYLEAGENPEDARFFLPNACVTRVVTSSNMRQIRQVMALRLESHAQWEIRIIHQQLFDILHTFAPCFVEDLKHLRDTGSWGESRPAGL